MRARALLLVVAVVSLVACGDADDETFDPGVTTTISVTTTSSTGATSTTTGGVSLGATCAADRYSIRYSAEWHTNDQGEPCGWFHPEPFELEAGTEATELAIHVDVAPVAFDQASQPGDTARELEREELTVDGQAAVRLLTEQTEEVLLPAGTRTLIYAVDLGGDETLLATTSDAAASSTTFAENQEMLDRMVEELVVHPGG